MTSWDRNIIRDADIRFLPSTNLQMWFILCINNVEDFLGYWSRIYAFKYDVVLLRLVNIYNIYYSIIVSYLKWEYLFAQFTIHFLEFNNNLSLMYLHGPFCLKPSLEAFQMNRIYGPRAIAWWYQWVKTALFVKFIWPPTYPASRLACLAGSARGDRIPSNCCKTCIFCFSSNLCMCLLLEVLLSLWKHLIWVMLNPWKVIKLILSELVYIANDGIWSHLNVNVININRLPILSEIILSYSGLFDIIRICCARILSTNRQFLFCIINVPNSEPNPAKFDNIILF